MSSMNHADSTATVSTSQLARILVAMLAGLAMQSLVAVAYTILRYGPTFRTELSSIPFTAIFVGLMTVIGCTAVVHLRMPRETPLATVAVAVILSNLVGAIGVYFAVYLAERAGLSM